MKRLSVVTLLLLALGLLAPFAAAQPRLTFTPSINRPVVTPLDGWKYGFKRFFEGINLGVQRLPFFGSVVGRINALAGQRLERSRELTYLKTLYALRLQAIGLPVAHAAGKRVLSFQTGDPLTDAIPIAIQQVSNDAVQEDEMIKAEISQPAVTQLPPSDQVVVTADVVEVNAVEQQDVQSLSSVAAVATPDVLPVIQNLQSNENIEQQTVSQTEASNPAVSADLSGTGVLNPTDANAVTAAAGNEVQVSESSAVADALGVAPGEAPSDSAQPASVDVSSSVGS